MVGTSVRERLRQGTAALLSRSAHEIALDKLEPDPEQPRKTHDPERAAELAESIRSQGVLSPLLVTQIPGTDRYRIVYGERRYHGAQEAGLQSVPCIVREQLDPLQTLLIQLTENLQREEPRPLEVAASIARLEKEFDLSRSEIARRLGCSPSWITNLLALLSATGPAREALDEGLVRDPETTRLFRQLPQTEQEALLEEARSTSVPIRRSAVQHRLTLVPRADSEIDQTDPDSSSPTLVVTDGAPTRADFQPPVVSNPEPRPGSEKEPRRRGRPARPRQKLIPLPSLSWEALGRLFERLDLDPPADLSELDEAFERFRNALS